MVSVYYKLKFPCGGVIATFICGCKKKIYNFSQGIYADLVK